MDQGKQLLKSPNSIEENAKEMKDTPYRSLACTLMYPSNITRPDIVFACNAACRHLQNPDKTHWEHLKRICRYIKGTLDLGLNFSSSRKDGQTPVGQITLRIANPLAPFYSSLVNV
jgi:hypothetical protein